MDNNIYQLLVRNFSVGTWLQTLLFYSFLFLIADMIFIQLKSSSKPYGQKKDESPTI